MSAPPLPEVFGNYALGDFVEVVAPSAIDWLPRTIGWQLLGMLLLGVALYRGGRRLAHWYRNRYRREAAAKITALRHSGDREGMVAELNRLLKLTTLAAWPREQVARLSGDEWVNFLNSQCTQPPFGGTQCELLAEGAYCNVTLAPAEQQALLDAGLAWVEQHRNPRDV